jgi:5-methyltetrahydropteroyltriglutamate--homocysteine methyltransferase
MKGPFRAEHVGSLPRPDRLMTAREEFAEGKIAKSELKRVERECIAEAVAMQERVGIGAITDGEYPKTGWREFLFEKCEGFASEPAKSDFPFTRFDGTTWVPFAEPRVIARLRRREPLSAEDFSLLKSLTKRSIKANLPSPSIAHFNGDATFDRAVYPDRDAYFADVVRVFREEIADLVARGCTYLQIDEVPIPVLCDPKNQAIVRKRGEDPDQLIDVYIQAINDSIRGRPADMAVAVHMCRGNLGHGMADGGYEPVAERIFGRLEVDGFLLEYDTPRAGDFAPLRFLPPGKTAVLGIVSSKLPEIESKDALKRRIDEACKFTPLDRLGICPQCGFGTMARRVDTDLGFVERKLARVVETAREIWG